MACCVVGISGGTCSGKTTLAQLLARHFEPDCVSVSQDWYYRDLSALPPVERARGNFDTPEAIEACLLGAQVAALAAGSAVEAPQYDFSLHTRRPERLHLEPASIVLVEGLHVIGLPELDGLLTLRVFVDAPDAVRLARRLTRDTQARGRTAAQVATQFEATVRPMHALHVDPLAARADVRVNGESPMEPAAVVLAKQIRELAGL